MSVGAEVKVVKGRQVRSYPFVPDDDYTDEEFASCLCGDVPADKRVDVQVRYFSEAQKKWRWKNIITSHADCPLHGSDPEVRKCREA